MGVSEFIVGLELSALDPFHAESGVRMMGLKCSLSLQCGRSTVSQVVYGQRLLCGDWFNPVYVRNVVGSGRPLTDP